MKIQNYMPNEIVKIGSGLRETPKDRRDLKLGQIIRWPKLEELPKSFELPALTIKNQGDTDFCTAMATCGMSELQEGIELNPQWSFAASKDISGDPEEFGQDLRTAMKSHQKYGAIEQTDFDKIDGNLWFDKRKESFRYFKNYPFELREKALVHKKQSYFEIANYPSGWTPSDAVKAAIWLFREHKRAVSIGVIWSWNLSEKRITTWNNQGSGHAMYVRGWDEEGFLIVQNSYGKEAGDNGDHYFSPVVIDQAVRRFKAFMFVDMPPEEAKKICWNKWTKFIEAIRNYINDLLK